MSRSLLPAVVGLALATHLAAQQPPSLGGPSVQAFVFGEPPTMAGVNLGDVQIFLERGAPHPEGFMLYFVVGDADELYAFHREGGVEILTAPEDRPYGLRDYAVRDLHGYGLSFGHYIYTVGEPVPIERVDVPVRLEKRLAALLHDLAEQFREQYRRDLEEWMQIRSRLDRRGGSLGQTKSPRYFFSKTNERLHSAAGYVTAADTLNGWSGEILRERDRPFSVRRTKSSRSCRSILGATISLAKRMLRSFLSNMAAIAANIAMRPTR